MFNNFVMRSRKARPDEFDSIYLMGLDVWNEGKDREAYLEGCRRSKKYQEGAWYVLENQEGVLVSSLIRYCLSEGVYGIGSIATPPSFRKKGYASKLIADVLKEFESEGVERVFLFSDIEPAFYQKFEFEALSSRYQHSAGSVCMVRGVSVEELERDPQFQPPVYF